MRCSSVIALLALVAGQAAAQEPLALDGRLSPDGTSVVARAVEQGSIRLLLVTPYDALDLPRWLTPDGVDVESAAWTPDGAAIVYRAAADGHLYRVSASATAPTAAPVDLTPGARDEVRLAGFADGAVLVELPGEVPGQPDLYRVPLAGGEPVLVRRNDAGVTRWVVDGASPRLAVREGEAGDTEIGRIRDDMVLPIFTCEPGAVCEPVGFHPDGRVWVRTNSDRAEPALVLVDPLTLETELVRSDLGSDPDALVREDSVYTRDVERLQALTGGAAVTFLDGPRGSGGRVLVAARDAAASTMYVFDRWAGSIVPVLPMADEDELRLALGLSPISPDASLEWPERLRYLVTDGEPGVPPIDVRRTIRSTTEGGRALLVIVDETEVPVFPTFELDTTLFSDPAFEPDLSFPTDDLSMAQAVDSTVLDAATLLPLRRRSTGPFSMALDFTPTGVSGSVTIDGFESGVSASTDGPVWSDGPALEILVAALPLEAGFQTDISYFDAGLEQVVTARLGVDAATSAQTPEGSIDAWSMTLSPRAEGSAEQRWLVRRDAPHLLLRSIIPSTDYDRAVEIVEGGRP